MASALQNESDASVTGHNLGSRAARAVVFRQRPPRGRVQSLGVLFLAAVGALSIARFSGLSDYSLDRGATMSGRRNGRSWRDRIGPPAEHSRFKARGCPSLRRGCRQGSKQNPAGLPGNG